MNMSSFRKRNVQKPIPGTRTSPQTGQLITSSGNPSLDTILGGGLPIGSICLIEEDKYVTHSKVLAKYFLAEGVVSLQSIFLGSLDDNPAELLRKLPKPLNDDEIEMENAECDQDDEASQAKNGLRIAWRYNDLPMVNSEQTPSKIGHHFNLLEPMDPLLLDYITTVLWNDTQCDAEGDDEDDEDDEDYNDENAETNAVIADSNSSSGGDNTQDIEMENAKNSSYVHTLGAGDQSPPSSSSQKGEEYKCAMTAPQTPPPPPPYVVQKPRLFENEKYLRLLKDLHPFLREDKFLSGALCHKSLCRVCITSLGSPLWYQEQFPKDILKFLTILRAAVRGSVSVCFITMPMHLVRKCDESLVEKIRNLVDYSIELESFAGSDRETNPAFKEYNGLLHLRKISAINTLCAYKPETADLAFKLRRKKFVIEKLHLPPELQESSGEEASAPTLSCGSTASPNPKASLDF